MRSARPFPTESALREQHHLQPETQAAAKQKCQSEQIHLAGGAPFLALLDSRCHGPVPHAITNHDAARHGTRDAATHDFRVYDTGSRVNDLQLEDARHPSIRHGRVFVHEHAIPAAIRRGALDHG